MSVLPDILTIRKRRKEVGLSQSEFADRVHISQSHMAKIEAGKVDPGYALVSTSKRKAKLMDMERNKIF